MCERDRKPSSVVDDHLSRPGVAARAQAIAKARRAAAYAFIASCIRWGLQHGQVAKPWVSSYLAFPSLPGSPGRYLSVALSLESPPPAVSRHPALRCSDFPHTLWGHAIVWSPRTWDMIPRGGRFVKPACDSNKGGGHDSCRKAWETLNHSAARWRLNLSRLLLAEIPLAIALPH